MTKNLEDRIKELIDKLEELGAEHRRVISIMAADIDALRTRAETAEAQLVAYKARVNDCQQFDDVPGWEEDEDRMNALADLAEDEFADIRD